MLAWVWNTESDRTYVSCSRMFAWTCVSFLETEITWNFILNPIDVFRRQRDRITQCYLSSIDIEFGLLMGDGLIFTSLSLIGPCKHQWSLFTRPYQQYVCCRVQVSVCEPLESVSTSCTVPTIEPRIRPLSVSLHVSTHFAKAEVTRFWSLELVHLRHVKLLLQQFLHTHSKRRSTTVHLVLSGPVPVVEDAVFPVFLFHSVQKEVLALLSIAVKSELPTFPLIFQIETWRPFVVEFFLNKICLKSSVMIGFPCVFGKVPFRLQ